MGYENPCSMNWFLIHIILRVERIDDYLRRGFWGQIHFSKAIICSDDYLLGMLKLKVSVCFMSGNCHKIGFKYPKLLSENQLYC